MAPRKPRTQATAAKSAGSSTQDTSLRATPEFPPISPKRRLQTRAILEDQILLLDVCPLVQLGNILSVECATRAS